MIIVEEIDGSANLIAGFKCTMPDNSCPPEVSDVIMSVPNTEQRWEKTERGWMLRKCIDDWVLFNRSESLFVCLKFFRTAFQASRVVAQNICIQNGAKLSGVANRAESDWMEKQAEPYSTGAWDGAWLDGVRSCAESEPNCHNYIWSDGFTTGNNAFGDDGWNLWSPNDTATNQSCLTVLSINNTQQRLNAVSCNDYDRAIGVICGYKLE